MQYDHLFSSHVNPYLGRLLQSLDLDKAFVTGHGTVLTGSDGRRYLDFIAGYGAVPFGHNPPEIWEAIAEVQRTGEPAFVQPSLLTAAAELARRLLAVAPPGLQHAFFCNSGAEAVEAAIKACCAATGRRRVVAAQGSFHGKTLGALSATGAAKYQDPFGAPVAGFEFVQYGRIDELMALFNRSGTEIAAVILEPIQGEGGVNMPSPGYLAKVRALCDRHGALLILDEVQTGLGRTGAMFAAGAAGVCPDCLTVAKALGGGMVPIGACLFGAAAYSEAFAMKHSSTFGGGALACRVGLGVVDRLTRDDGALLRHVRERSAELKAGLREIAALFPRVITDVRGEGLLLGVEFAIDRTAFASDHGSMLGVLAEQGKLVPLLASYLLNVEGIRTAPSLNDGAVMRVEPPLTVSRQECKIFLEAMETVASRLARGDTGALLAHLAGAAVPAVTPRAKPFPPCAPLRPNGEPSEGRFAFLVHTIDQTSYTGFDRSLACLTSAEIDRLDERMGPLIEPFVIASARITSRTGATAFGDFVVVPHTAQRLLEMPPDESLGIIQEAVRLAAARGARIVGLGGYTSIVTDGGSLATSIGVPVTTGNSYTLVAAMEAIDLACRRLDLSLRDLHVAVIGAGGSIGAAATRILIGRAGRLTLVGNPASPARTRSRLRSVIHQALRSLGGAGMGEAAPAPLVAALAEHPAFAEGLWDGEDVRLADRLLDGNGAEVPLAWSMDCAAVLPDCDIVVAATSSTEALILPEMLKPGAVVCDLSRPSNIGETVAASRPDVLIIDGGVIEVPGRPALGWNFGYPKGLCYACMAETMMLGLEQHYQHTSIGCDLDLKSQRLVQRLAAKHGFRLAELRSFDRVLTDADLWARSGMHGAPDRPSFTVEPPPSPIYGNGGHS